MKKNTLLKFNFISTLSDDFFHYYYTTICLYRSLQELIDYSDKKNLVKDHNIIDNFNVDFVFNIKYLYNFNKDFFVKNKISFDELDKIHQVLKQVSNKSIFNLLLNKKSVNEFKETYKNISNISIDAAKYTEYSNYLLNLVEDFLNTSFDNESLNIFEYNVNKLTKSILYDLSDEVSIINNTKISKYRIDICKVQRVLNFHPLIKLSRNNNSSNLEISFSDISYLKNYIYDSVKNLSTDIDENHNKIFINEKSKMEINLFLKYFDLLNDLIDKHFSSKEIIDDDINLFFNKNSNFFEYLYNESKENSLSLTSLNNFIYKLFVHKDFKYISEHNSLNNCISSNLKELHLLNNLNSYSNIKSIRPKIKI